MGNGRSRAGAADRAYANALAEEEGLAATRTIRDHRRLDLGARVRAAAARGGGDCANDARRSGGRPLERRRRTNATLPMASSSTAAATFTFGELAEEAADRTPPPAAPLRKTRQGTADRPAAAAARRAGQGDGSLRFAGDVRLPSMLFASVRIAPPGGTAQRFSREAVKGAPGVRHRRRARWLAGRRRRQLVGGGTRAEGRRSGVLGRCGRPPTCGRCSTTRSPRATQDGSAAATMSDGARIASACRHLLCRAVAASRARAGERDGAHDRRRLSRSGRATQAPGFGGASEATRSIRCRPASRRAARWSRMPLPLRSSSRES